MKAAPWIVHSPTGVLYSASMIGLTIYGTKRSSVGNLSSGPTILSACVGVGLRGDRRYIEDNLTGGEDNAPARSVVMAVMKEAANWGGPSCRIRPLAISKHLTSKTQFNGVSRLRTYLSVTHSAF
jgi:hypothetical protein